MCGNDWTGVLLQGLERVKERKGEPELWMQGLTEKQGQRHQALDVHSHMMRIVYA